MYIRRFNKFLISIFLIGVAALAVRSEPAYIALPFLFIMAFMFEAVAQVMISLFKFEDFISSKAFEADKYELALIEKKRINKN